MPRRLLFSYPPGPKGAVGGGFQHLKVQYARPTTWETRIFVFLVTPEGPKGAPEGRAPKKLGCPLGGGGGGDLYLLGFAQYCY